MTSDLRRVRRLRLTAPEEPFIRRAAVLLDDALRIASLPDAGRGRLVFVRSLSLGSIRTSVASTAIALAIEERIRALCTDAIPVDTPGAEDAVAVYFCDDLEPYRLLLGRVLDGTPIRGWFWAAAVPEWHPRLTQREAVRALLIALTCRVEGPAAMIAAVRPIAPPHRDVLVSNVESDLAARICETCGWSVLPTGFEAQHPHATERPSRGSRKTNSPQRSQTNTTPELDDDFVSPGSWEYTFRKWAPLWPRGDARTAWLAAVALAADGRMHLSDSRLPAAAARAAHQSHEFRLRAEETLTATIGREHSPAPAPEFVEETNGLALQHRAKEHAPAERPLSARSHGTAPSTTYRALDEDTSELMPQDRRMTPPRVDDCRASGLEHAPANVQRIHQERSFPTQYGGLLFLIPVFVRLGMAEFLDAHPHLLVSDLPRQVLASVLVRLGAAAPDSARDLLGGPLSPMSEFAPFVAPARWADGIARGSRWVVSPQSARGSRLLCDGTGRLPLASWTAPAPAAVHTLAGAHRVVHRRQLSTAFADEPAVVAGWVTATRRWCRRYAHAGLHRVVCRPARMRTTATHIDVSFDHRDADAAIRRAGLDIDPGWVPWFSRVVQFHYVYGHR